MIGWIWSDSVPVNEDTWTDAETLWMQDIGHAYIMCSELIIIKY